MHTHTCYSDGDLNPAELVKLAKNKGMKILSITDHDTVDGLCEARWECGKQNITLIPGIEFTTETEYSGIEVHILGYNFDPEDSRLLRMTDHAKQNAKDYCMKVCSELESHDMEIDYSLLDNVKGIITKHDITLSVMNKEMSNYDFHNIWLSEDSPLNITMEIFPAKKVIRTIHETGGKAVCAHILRTLEQSNRQPLFPYMTESLIRCGLDGFEVFYANSSKEQVQKMYELCSAQRLIMTGGSDFHGTNRTGRCQLGEYNSYTSTLFRDISGILCKSYNNYPVENAIA
ncbi:PHP domain-containing protein [Methanolobus vulcani]|uniref:PHP domain-containing protein n=1 Tax=Methanolobus vulcani TaxID=38026 RepID=UPI0018ACB859|nr:PHP domain-containing protein [Methanolobus vulcani]